MNRITIQNANMCKIEGPAKVLLRLFKEFRIKHPNAWHITMYQKNRRGKYQWDGYIKYLSQDGRFKIGLLPMVVNLLKEWGESVKIIDNRPPLPVNPEIPEYLGNIKLYPRQKKALENILFNKVKGHPFLIEVGDFSVGFGKTLIFCAIHEAFKRKLRTVLLLNDSDLFNQFKSEIPKLLPGEDVKFIQGAKSSTWGNFNVVMVQTLSRNLKKFYNDIIKVGIVLIDEADIIDNKTYSNVITHLYNTQVRIGLSGTIYMSKLKKDLVHNMNIRSFIGDKVDSVKLIDQIKTGKATPVIVKMIYNNLPEMGGLDYPEEYNKAITNNLQAYKLSFSRSAYNAKYGRFPQLIVTKFIDHCEKLYKYYQDINLKENLGYVIKYVHHETKERNQILNEFREGKIDILISTTIISRGKNFPLLKYLQNTASMDSNEKAIQILGRLVRQHESKTKAYMDDIVFNGHYLTRHGNHRKIYYQKEKLKVIRILDNHVIRRNKKRK